jgi:hypothetical protein
MCGALLLGAVAGLRMRGVPLRGARTAEPVTPVPGPVEAALAVAALSIGGSSMSRVALAAGSVSVAALSSGDALVLVLGDPLPLVGALALPPAFALGPATSGPRAKKAATQMMPATSAHAASANATRPLPPLRSEIPCVSAVCVG